MLLWFVRVRVRTWEEAVVVEGRVEYLQTRKRQKQKPEQDNDQEDT